MSKPISYQMGRALARAPSLRPVQLLAGAVSWPRAGEGDSSQKGDHAACS